MKKSTVKVFFCLVAVLLLGFQAYGGPQQETAAVERPIIDVAISSPSVHFEEPEDEIAKDRVKKYLEERFGFNLTYRSLSGSKNEYGEMIVREMAAGTPPELINIGIDWYVNMLDFRKWIADELVIDLGQYVLGDPDKYPALKLAFDHPLYNYLNEYFLGDPEQYSVWYSIAFRKRAYGAFFMNGIMLQEMGLDVPETYAELVTAMRRAKETYDIPGIGWVSYDATHWGYVSDIFFETHGLNAYGLFQDDDGEWYEATIDPRNKARWREIQQFAREGLIDPKWMTNNYDVLNVDFVADKIFAASTGGPGQYQGHFENHFVKTHPDAVVGVDLVEPAYPLKGPGGQTVHRENPFSVSAQWFVPYTVEDPERIVEFMNFLASDEWQRMIYWGIKGIHYTKDDLSDWSEDEFLQDCWIWFPGNPRRSQYPWFRWFLNGNQYYSPFEKFGDWMEGVKAGAGVYPPNDRIAGSPAADYMKAQQQRYIENGLRPTPIYSAHVKWTEEEMQIQTRLTDVRNTWFTWFVTGEEDVDQGWDNFVRQFRAAGSDQIVAAYGDKMAAAKAKWDKAFK